LIVQPIRLLRRRFSRDALVAIDGHHFKPKRSFVLSSLDTSIWQYGRLSSIIKLLLLSRVASRIRVHIARATRARLLCSMLAA
jgi:hypothetical protein